MQTGQVVAIFIAPTKGSAMENVNHVEAIAGRGLAGDRYSEQIGTIKKGIRHITLIEEEALTAVRRDYCIEVHPNETRRNVLTRGIALNHLVGRKFQVGRAVLLGVELSEPCGYLEKLTGKKIKEALTHRGGLRAEILTSGAIEVGAQILEECSNA